MNIRFIAGGLAAVTVVTAASPCSVYAADNYSMRKKVISTAGIVQTGSQESAPVSRGEFARMLVMASVYHDSVAEEGSLPLYVDVPADHIDCAYIRIAAEQGWVTAYLGGRFKPDEPVKMLDAARACLRLLGYADEDLSGTTVYSRMAKFNSLELNDEIGKVSTDTLTVSDCVNLFYNLLNTNTKENENKIRPEGPLCPEKGREGALHHPVFRQPGFLLPERADQLKG